MRIKGWIQVKTESLERIQKRALKSTPFCRPFVSFPKFGRTGSHDADGPGAAYEFARETAENTASEENTASAEEMMGEGPISMDVVYGYDNVAKSGRFLPLDILLDNTREIDFNGV